MLIENIYFGLFALVVKQSVTVLRKLIFKVPVNFTFLAANSKSPLLLFRLRRLNFKVSSCSNNLI